METVTTIYHGALRTEATHVKSGNKIITDAPTDNQGKGEAFSPTDLLVTSLSSCMLTIMGIFAERHNLDIAGTVVKTTKIMAENPRRVSEIRIDFQMPANNFTEKEQTHLKNAALTCPVSKSLHPDILQVVVFNF